MARPTALAFLAWRALLVQPLKRLFHRGSGLERFRAAYDPDGLAPTRPEDLAVALVAARCVGCGLCEVDCRLAGASPAVRALGLPAAFRLAGRAQGDLGLARDLLEACAGCAACAPACPTGVDIRRVVEHLQGRVGVLRPAIVGVSSAA
jgi:succinate dehydrogenase/fumarate reductase-like Fe-S protein